MAKLDELLELFFVDIAESDVEDIEELDDVDIDETEEDEVVAATDDAADDEAVAVAGDEGAVRFSRFAVIQGCWRISSIEIRSAGLSLRHFLTRSWHSWVSLVRNLRSALQICSSCSKGMSPQTMS